MSKIKKAAVWRVVEIYDDPAIRRRVLLLEDEFGSQETVEIPLGSTKFEGIKLGYEVKLLTRTLVKVFTPGGMELKSFLVKNPFLE